MENNIELTNNGGLKCDNPSCDWEDTTIKMEDYGEWVNKPCPKCGENVLSEGDYTMTQALHSAVDFINSLGEGELKELNDMFDMESIDELKSHPMFEEAEGLDNLNEIEDSLEMKIEVKDGIRVKSIKKDIK